MKNATLPYQVNNLSFCHWFSSEVLLSLIEESVVSKFLVFFV